MILLFVEFFFLNFVKSIAFLSLFVFFFAFLISVKVKVSGREERRDDGTKETRETFENQEALSWTETPSTLFLTRNLSPKKVII